MSVDWNRCAAAVYRPDRGALKGIERIEVPALEDLVGIDGQKAKIIANTEAFLAGRPAQNVLLWGSRGTGKSSLVRALLGRYAEEGLRIVEFFKEDLHHLSEILDELRSEPRRFILYLDDLTFREGESTYTYLKSAMEGSIEPPPENLLVYATTNRRHLLPEYQRENAGTRVGEAGEIHYADAVEEKIALADRFGLWLSFYSPDERAYLQIVEHYFRNEKIDREALRRAALGFARERAARSGRTARQFWESYRNDPGILQ